MLRNFLNLEILQIIFFLLSKTLNILQNSNVQNYTLGQNIVHPSVKWGTKTRYRSAR